MDAATASLQFSNLNPGCQLHKSIDSLKQATTLWYEKLVAEPGRLGYEPSAADSVLFVKQEPKVPMYMFVPVDDLLFAVATVRQVTAVKAAIGSYFTV